MENMTNNKTTITNQITIEVKNNYGAQIAYPVCERSKLFAKLAGTRTLTAEALRIIAALGYTINLSPTKNVFGELIGGLNA